MVLRDMHATIIVEVRKSRPTKKRMTIAFFGKRGIVERVVFEKQRTIIRFWYIQTSSKSHWTTGIWDMRSQLNTCFLHHDNATVHKSKGTNAFLVKSGLILLDLPPLISDFAPCDWFISRSQKTSQRKAFF